MLKRLEGIGRSWRIAASVVVLAATARPFFTMAEIEPVRITVMRALIPLVFLATGLIAAARRPANPFGPLLVLCAFLATFAPLSEPTPAWLTANLIFNQWADPVLAYLLLSFPLGRLTSRLDRGIVAAYAVVLFAINGLLVFGVPFDGKNLLYAAPPDFDPSPALNFLGATVYAKVLIWVAMLALLLHLVRGTPPARRILGPVFVAALLFTLHVALDSYYLRGNTVPGSDAEFWQMIVPETVLRSAIPLAFLAGLLHTRVTRSGVGELIVDLGRLPASGPVRDLLARALGDPSLRVGFWAVGLGRYVDASGNELPLPGPDEPQVASHVNGHGGRLAVLVHDAHLLEDPGLIDAVVAAARLSLENEGLQAEVRAQLAEVRASRERIVAAGDEQRKRIERDLHDGAQQRLVSLTLALRMLRDRDGPEADALLAEAEAQAQDAIDELRDLARGIYPSALTEGGLADALRALAVRSAVPVDLGELPADRLPPRVEAAAYFLCCEALTNATKHGAADRVAISADVHDDGLAIAVRDDGRGGAEMQDGSGLRGMADRVEALGGHLRISSPVGAGTTVEGWIPLGAREVAGSPA